MKPPKVLSIQSHVVHGHVGNSVAVFVLQRHGIEVLPLHTLQFSNHPGYRGFRGRIAEPDELLALLNGLDEGGFLAGVDAVLSGYVGKAESGGVVLDAVRRVKRYNPRALYVCDPVMGDVDRGAYVSTDIIDFFRHEAIALADIVLPNRFELQLLAGQSDLDIKQQIERIHSLGPKHVVVTSAFETEAMPVEIGSILSTGEALYRCSAQKHRLAANGTGDCLAALLVTHWLKGERPPDAFGNALSALHVIIEATSAAGARELALIASQDLLVAPPKRLTVERISL
jgi:pyridoxine kinase